jgi:hypothetical protein
MFRKLRRKVVRLVVVSGAGAAATYFFDRDRGPERREQAKEKAASLVGRQSSANDWQSSAGGYHDRTGVRAGRRAANAVGLGQRHPGRLRR